MFNKYSNNLPSSKSDSELLDLLEYALMPDKNEEPIGEEALYELLLQIRERLLNLGLLESLYNTLEVYGLDDWPQYHIAYNRWLRHVAQQMEQ